MVLAESLSGDRPESALTSDNSENTTDAVRSCQPGGEVPAGGVAWGRDDAYVQPVLVGRLTAAALTYALDGRRFGGRSRISLQEGRPAGGGGPDQEVER